MKTKKGFKFSFYQRGFTLIELIVVIAIIGILTAIIISSLSNSKWKAGDSKVKQQLTSFRSAAEIYFSNQNPTSYGPVVASDCTTPSSIFTNTNAVDGRPGSTISQPVPIPSTVTLICSSSGSAYAVKATLYSGTEYYCVDSKGAGKVMPGSPVAGTTC